MNKSNDQQHIPVAQENQAFFDTKAFLEKAIKQENANVLYRMVVDACAEIDRLQELLAAEIPPDTQVTGENQGNQDAAWLLSQPMNQFTSLRRVAIALTNGVDNKHAYDRAYMALHIIRSGDHGTWSALAQRLLLK